MTFEKLFEPIKVGPVTVKNRYAYAPTNTFDNWLGYMSEQEIAYFTARAMGGTGMIIVGAYLSTKFGVPYMQHPWMFCYDITHVPGLSALAKNIRLAGATAILQLLPVPSSLGQNWTGTQPVAPSAVEHIRPKGWLTPKLGPLIAQRMPNSLLARTVGLGAPNQMPREITLDEIQTVIDENAMACRLAAAAGFDGIELHMCHGYMVDEFRHPIMNRRTDRYGGSEENRNRLLLELAETSIRATKEENPNMVVGIRMGCACGEGGYDFEETKRLALQMQKLGIEYYHVTYAEGGPAPHSVPFQDGILLQFSKELRKILKIPVITSGIHDPKLAEKAVAEGQTDMVSTARCHVADAEFVNKIKENRLNDIIKCTDCGSCAGLFTVGVSCLHNPETGRERYNPKYQLWKGFKGAAALHPSLQRKGAK